MLIHGSIHGIACCRHGHTRIPAHSNECKCLTWLAHAIVHRVLSVRVCFSFVHVIACESNVDSGFLRVSETKTNAWMPTTPPIIHWTPNRMDITRCSRSQSTIMRLASVQTKCGGVYAFEPTHDNICYIAWGIVLLAVRWNSLNYVPDRRLSPSTRNTIVHHDNVAAVAQWPQLECWHDDDDDDDKIQCVYRGIKKAHWTNHKIMSNQSSNAHFFPVSASSLLANKYTLWSELRSFCAFVTGLVRPWARAEASPNVLIISVILVVASLQSKQDTTTC